jgi:hypothetical protein
MAVVSQQPIDLQWITSLASGTVYVGEAAAIAAAIVLSAANANAPVQIGQVNQVASAPNGAILAQVNMAGLGNPIYVIQLNTAGTVYPLTTAMVAAYALSAANGNAPVNVSRVIVVIAAP